MKTKIMLLGLLALGIIFGMHADEDDWQSACTQEDAKGNNDCVLYNTKTLKTKTDHHQICAKVFECYGRDDCKTIVSCRPKFQ